MSRRKPYFVIADDLTGSAELAALAHQAGLRVAVWRDVPSRCPRNVDVLVCDSGTRLDSPQTAARKVRKLAARLRTFPHAGIFKKADSVLRGNVMAEIDACLSALDLRRALLVPCNPSLGRIIRQGRYSIGGQPLPRTSFARDPHHPRKSAQISQLLGQRAGTVTCLHPADHLPERGVAVGEASSPADVALWAARLDAQTLPAGGADFFRSWLVKMRAVRRTKRARGALTPSPTFVLSGTTATSLPISPLTEEPFEVHARSIPTPTQLTTLALARLRSDGALAVATNRGISKKSDLRINALFADVARRVRDARGFEHVLVAGATTASSVLDGLDWRRLDVVRVWGPGAVTLRPIEAPRFLVTVKPGSYSWPVDLRRQFTPAAGTRPCNPVLNAAR